MATLRERDRDKLRARNLGILDVVNAYGGETRRVFQLDNWFTPPYPARTTVGSDLHQVPGMMIEIEAIAVL